MAEVPAVVRVTCRWADKRRLRVTVHAGRDAFHGGWMTLSTLAGAAITDDVVVPAIAMGATWRGEVLVGEALATLWLDVHQTVPPARLGMVVMGPPLAGEDLFASAYPHPGRG